MAATFDRMTMLTPEDLFYFRKIEAMANERLVFFRDKKLLGSQATSRNTSMKRQRWSTTPSTKQDDHKKRKVQKQAVVTNEATERLKEFVVNEMKGTDMKLVIQKTLYDSDTKKGLNRLNMPVNQVENDEFLTDEEKRVVYKRNTKENEIEVGLLGPRLEMYEGKKAMKLKTWDMASTVNYVLTGMWYDFWKENKGCLKQNSLIQVWSFRKDERLCFAVVACGEA